MLSPEGRGHDAIADSERTRATASLEGRGAAAGPPAPPEGVDPALAPPTGLVERLHLELLGRAGTPEELATVVRRRVRQEAPLLAEPAVEACVAAVSARLRGLGALEPVLADPAVSEVMVNGAGPVWVERHGRLEVTPVTLTAVEVDVLIERVVGPLGLRVDRASPIADARLPDGSRVNVVVPPLAVDGPCVTIRRFGARAVRLDELAAPGIEGLLRWAVASRCNIVVSGATGAGKTTLLNALASVAPRHERIVTVEDAAELRLPGDHVVRLEARPPNAEGAGEVRIRDLVRNALRMRPDRIVVGEVRGAEALDMLQALNTGHDGSLSTCHANGPADALRRIETMVLMAGVALPLTAVREQLASAIDLIVHVARLPDGRRAVVEVGEVAHPGAGGTGSDGPLGGSGSRGVTAASPVDGGVPGGPTAGVRLRRLAGPGGVVALPARAARVAGAPDPDPGWLAASDDGPHRSGPGSAGAVGAGSGRVAP